ncbi:MAG: caspase family protein [Magnetococcales bacterium]|nr:caspase family protein [Magnetococcales bacterium]
MFRYLAWGLGLLFFWVALLSPVLGQAQENYALLVGVSNYRNLDAAYTLNGPVNDIPLIRDLLLQRGFARERMTLLADGVEGADALPTRQAILDALERLARTVGRGDYVYLHFGGHGSQSPVSAASAAQEADGRDEIFLPIDVGSWDDEVGEVEGSLRDDEVADRLTAIRNRGAFVWAVFDACHSGTMTRGSPVEEKDRRLDPLVLGVPEGAFAKSRGGRGGEEDPGVSPLQEGESLPLAADAGGVVTFFAAQSTETTPDRRLPDGDPERRPHGLFSFTLAKVLNGNPGMTYRLVAQRILHEYAANRESATPLFGGGKYLDAPVFGSRPEARKPEWRVVRQGEGLTLKAGSMHQIGEGSLIALFPKPGAAEKELLGHARVASVRMSESELVPVARGDGSVLDPGQLTATLLHGRLLERSLSLGLRVSPPQSPGVEGKKADHLLDEVVAGLLRDPPTALRLQRVSPEEGPDLRLLIREGRLWFLPPNAELVTGGAGRTPSILGQGSTVELREKVVASLTRIAKVTNLLRLGEHMVGQEEYRQRLRVRGRVTPVQREGLGQAALAALQQGRCPGLPRGEPFEIDPLRIPRLGGCDRVDLVVENVTEAPVDLTILFVDAEFGIAPLFPDNSQGDLGRIEAKGQKKIPGFELHTTGEGGDHSGGREGLLFLAVEAEPGMAAADFTFLAQESLPKERGGSARDGNELTSLLSTIGFVSPGGAERFRSRLPAPVVDRTDMQILRWDTVIR